ncbi:MAG: hypothetical protein A2234_04520 [Elusimicrobia bacterium RIFOXYA2_FULL_58_8]|nr:MAG: hypothetical protein A2285_03710 [Elusimicrobia bacterium RIFOXYA12_FULL_57_11]OGS15519.1 MAG: hypothetical protein A2234_04520 [Elusimicrobia bacterium RIFOXYA2_FULL_58_8]
MRAVRYVPFKTSAALSGAEYAGFSPVYSMELIFIFVLVGFFALLGLGYIAANTWLSRVVSMRLSTRGDKAVLLAERYLVQASLASTELARRNRQLSALTEQLNLSSQELARLNEMKSKFLSMVVHDVRSPLAAIRGFSQMLGKKMTGERERAQFANIVSSADQLGRLVSDLTDIAMIEAGKLTVEPAPFDLRLIAADILPGQKIKTADKGIILLYSECASPVQVNGDRFRLGQVLMNFLGNAIKFTPAGHEVELSIQAAGPWAEVRVRDSGIGVHPSEVKKIFEKFYQAKYQKDAALRKQGWGLGLSIAAEIVKAHKGEIWAQSQGLGKGSVFCYRVPLSQ